MHPYARPVSIHGDQDLGANNVSAFKAELKMVPDHKDMLRQDPRQKVCIIHARDIVCRVRRYTI